MSWDDLAEVFWSCCIPIISYLKGTCIVFICRWTEGHVEHSWWSALFSAWLRLCGKEFLQLQDQSCSLGFAPCDLGHGAIVAAGRRW